MKTCGVCNATADDAAPTCAFCGEGSWTGAVAEEAEKPKKRAKAAADDEKGKA